jgi:hypothetical protein
MTTEDRHQYWQQCLIDWQVSSLWGAAYCKQHSITYHQFTYWRRKLLEDDLNQQQGSAGFTRVTAIEPQPLITHPELTLTLPSGVVITGLHVGNVDVLGAILRQL